MHRKQDQALRFNGSKQELNETFRQAVFFFANENQEKTLAGLLFAGGTPPTEAQELGGHPAVYVPGKPVLEPRIRNALHQAVKLAAVPKSVEFNPLEAVLCDLDVHKL